VAERRARDLNPPHDALLRAPIESLTPPFSLVSVQGTNFQVPIRACLDCDVPVAAVEAS